MSISRKISSATGAALASVAAAGAVTVFSSPTMSLVAHADETHGQNVSTDPSVGDNSKDVKDPTQVSTIDDAYKDVQGDTARDTNQSQHSSIGWEFQDPDQAAESWKAPDDTKVEPGTDNTQTDWNIATGTNGKSASDTSYDVTGDSSENKFNPGNVNLYGVSAVSDKSASVRENWPAIEKANMAYDDFVNQYGTYWGPVYWGWYTHGVGYPTAYGYYGYPGYAYPGAVVGGGATVVNNNNNNNNNNSSNNNALNGLNGLASNLMAVNGGNNGGSGSNGGNGNGGSVNGQQAGQQQQGQQGQNSSSSSSSSNSQTTVLPGGGVIGGVGYGVGGLGVVSSNNNNNNNNNNNSNNLNNLASLSNLASVGTNNGVAGNGFGNNGNNGAGTNDNQANKGNDDATDKKNDGNNGATKAADPAKDKNSTPVAVATTDPATSNADTGSAVATGSGDGAGAGSGSGAGSDVGTAVAGDAASTGLPQTGNMHLEKSSVVGAGVIGATLLAMGASRKKKEL